MVNKHLTDTEVQQYAADKHQDEKRIADHIHLCEECRMKVKVYELLITEIKQQPQPAFDFDLAGIVLKQLPLSKTKTLYDKILIGLVAFICIVFTCTAFYHFRGYFNYFFDGIKTIVIILIAFTALTVLAGLCIDMYKKYREEMKVMDFR